AAAGAPVAGADLWLVTMDFHAGEGRTIVLTKARSDESGGVRLARLEGGDRTSSRDLGLWAHRPSLRLDTAALRKDGSAPEGGGPIRLTLRPTAEVRFRVVDPDGHRMLARPSFMGASNGPES